MNGVHHSRPTGSVWAHNSMIREASLASQGNSLRQVGTRDPDTSRPPEVNHSDQEQSGRDELDCPVPREGEHPQLWGEQCHESETEVRETLRERDASPTVEPGSR